MRKWSTPLSTSDDIVKEIQRGRTALHAKGLAFSNISPPYIAATPLLFDTFMEWKKEDGLSHRHPNPQGKMESRA